MRVAIFSTKPYDRRFLEEANEGRHELQFFEARLAEETMSLAEGFDAVCAFVNDTLDRPVLEALHRGGVRLVAMRCAGYNNVDLEAAKESKLCVCRVPAYSPYAVAEHALTLMLSLNRKVHRAHARVREGNFSLDGLLGFDMRGCTAGIVGTGKIGVVTAELLAGFGMTVLGYDPYPNDDFTATGASYVDRDELLERSEIISLHCPLTPETKYIVNSDSIAKMNEGVMLINTSRGASVDTAAVIDGLKSGRIGAVGLDVYEEEGDLFFEDLSDQVIQDDVFARLLTFPNVLVTGHQAFFTREALKNIAETTLDNITTYEEGGACQNSIYLDQVKRKS